MGVDQKIDLTIIECKEKLDKQLHKFSLIMVELLKNLNVPHPDDLKALRDFKDEILVNFNNAIEIINKIEVIDYFSSKFILVKINNNESIINEADKIIKRKDYESEKWSEIISEIDSNLYDVTNFLLKEKSVKDFELYRIDAENLIEKLKRDQIQLLNKIHEVDIISDDLKNKKVHEIFEDDSEKFKKLARRYEIAFYIALAFLFLYFFGWYAEIDTAIFKFKFAEQFYGNHTPTFYVQKISILILSSTLAAFLLKRSFMNRRLADDAYRTAKELDALPRYMEGMPDEMKEKIRFDLAYKYFGNGIHHESYTGGENLMHENIKANTDFIKAVKDLTPKVEVPKVDKAPKDAA